MTSLRFLDIKVAYPGSLGPTPPKGYCFLIDDFGNWLTDDNGVFLVVPETGV